MLFAGLRPKGYDSKNNIAWDTEGGLIFQPISIAYTEKGIPLPPSDSDFSLDITMDLNYNKGSSFQVILLLYGDNRWEQIALCLWDNSLVFLNGWDYSDRRNSPKMSIPLKDGEEYINLLIESGVDGTRAYINGKLREYSSELTITFPSNRDATRLILGSEARGYNAYCGTIYELALSDLNGKSYFFYDFMHTTQEKEVNDFNGVGLSLNIPARRPILVKRFLQRPRLWQLRRTLLQLDMVINLIGFIPLGFFLYLFLHKYISNQKIMTFLVSLSLIFLFSLFLETIQVWIPTRDSSFLDLFLNSWGGLIGVITAIFFSKYPNSLDYE
ncbi:MAG: VanZ family protein [Spirochaetales bacterium]|nr:VanZ family protein [Spirochaetales bacterium]